MTCKDCIHYDVCHSNDIDLGFGNASEKYCLVFKNKADVKEVKKGKWYVDSPFACSVCDGLNDQKLKYAAEFEKWLADEPCIVRIIAWHKWKNNKPKRGWKNE